MSFLFQKLIDCLQFLFEPVFEFMHDVVTYIAGFFSAFFYWVLYLVFYCINALIYALSWVLDQLFVNFVLGLRTIIGTTGILSYLPSSVSSYIGNIVQAGGAGITWVKNFVNLQAFVGPLETYLGFLLVWTCYKIIKSWIPGVGR